MTASVAPARLPAWRLALAILIFGAMAAVLVSLAPVYWNDYRLRGGLEAVASAPGAGSAPENALRDQVTGRARELGLPVRPGDIRVSRENGKLRMEVRYAVHFPLYEVDLHFHDSARGQ